MLAFLGALLGHVLGRRATREADKRWHREETLRTMRWAAEVAAETDLRRRELGAVALEGLLKSPLLQSEDAEFIALVTGSVVEERLEEMGPVGARDATLDLEED